MIGCTDRLFNQELLALQKRIQTGREEQKKQRHLDLERWDDDDDDRDDNGGGVDNDDDDLDL